MYIFCYFLENVKRQAKERLETLREDATDEVQQLKKKYQEIEDKLEADYKGFLAKIRMFLKKLLSVFD